MNNTGKKFGGRTKGTPNKLTSRIKEEIGDIVNHTLMSIDIANLKPIEKIKLLQVLCQYIIPRLTTQHLDIEKRETPREVQITIVDTDGNVKEKVKETTEVVMYLSSNVLISNFPNFLSSITCPKANNGSNKNSSFFICF